jgi:hypothetical protein
MSIKDAKADVKRLTNKYTIYSILMGLGELCYEYSEHLEAIGESGSKYKKSAKTLVACANRIYNIWRK